jgi:hypothetical protein
MITVNGIFLSATEIVQRIDDGDIDALLVMIEIKRLEKQIEQIKESAAKLAVKEAELYGQKTFELHGAKIELAELGTRYIYDGCNYPPYQSAKSKASEANELVKSSETWLKSIKGSTKYIDPETGEMCDVYPPAKQSTTGIKITLK